MALIMMRTQFNEAGFKGIVSDPRNRRERPRQDLSGWAESLKRCTTCLPQRNG